MAIRPPRGPGGADHPVWDWGPSPKAVRCLHRDGAGAPLRPLRPLGPSSEEPHPCTSPSVQPPNQTVHDGGGAGDFCFRIFVWHLILKPSRTPPTLWVGTLGRWVSADILSPEPRQNPDNRARFPLPPSTAVTPQMGAARDHVRDGGIHTQSVAPSAPPPSGPPRTPGNVLARPTFHNCRFTMLCFCYFLFGNIDSPPRLCSGV